MNRASAIDILKRLRARLEARGVAHAGVFGSVARDQLRPSSDIDVVVTPAAQARLNLIDFGGIQTELEDAFPGRDVDLLIEPIMDDVLRKAVNGDRINAF